MDVYISSRQMPRPVNPHGEEVEVAQLYTDMLQVQIQLHQTSESVKELVMPKLSFEDTYLVDEEEDLDDVDVVVKPECEPSMV